MLSASPRSCPTSPAVSEGPTPCAAANHSDDDDAPVFAGTVSSLASSFKAASASAPDPPENTTKPDAASNATPDGDPDKDADQSSLGATAARTTSPAASSRDNATRTSPRCDDDPSTNSESSNTKPTRTGKPPTGATLNAGDIPNRLRCAVFASFTPSSSGPVLRPDVAVTRCAPTPTLDAPRGCDASFTQVFRVPVHGQLSSPCAAPSSSR